MKYGTVCSGIEAPSVAWDPLGWKPQFFSEIEKFPSAVLNHHYPDVPNLGDMTKYKEWPDHGQLGLICGGTPCQSFSVAGLRKGMDDPRGNLALVFLALVDRYRPRWVVWENVPGVLSSNNGRDFGAFLGGLGQLRYGVAYRTLDAQYFGVPQRRRRVFVIGYLGDWRPAGAVLLEREGLRRNHPPSKTKGQGVAGFTPGSIGGYREGCGTLRGSGGDLGGGSETLAVKTYNMKQHHKPEESDTMQLTSSNCSTVRGDNTPLVMAHGQGGAEIVKDGSPSLTCNHEAPIVLQNDRGAYMGQNGPVTSEDNTFTLNTVDKQVVAFKVRGGCEGGGKGFLGSEEKAFTVSTHQDQDIFTNSTVRRLTPRECERLQGFPDDYTMIDWRKRASKSKIDTDILKYIMRSGCSEERALQVYLCPDGPRYKALGNSMAVPVMAWIGRRIQMVEELLS